MTLKISPSNFSRFEGCTLTGALSVTTNVCDAVSIVHGPKGCSHHNFSLLHATLLDNETVKMPEVVSTGLSETDIVFGSEDALFHAISTVAAKDPKAVFVLSTCIIDTIGDDVTGVCGKGYGVPVIVVPTAGFLGGTFQNGVNNALCALADTAPPCKKECCVNIIGEKNLEYEVGENYSEVLRFLDALGIAVNARFVHTTSFETIALLGKAQLNILREPALIPVGEHLKKRFGTPFVPSFPLGLSGTLSFIREVARACGCGYSHVIDAERKMQEEMLAGFFDLAGSAVTFDRATTDSYGLCAAVEIAEALHMTVADDGCCRKIPAGISSGTTGVRRILHRWRRAVNA
jgi:nitrogenase molybdenum-iron protein alpha/beta subunit